MKITEWVSCDTAETMEKTLDALGGFFKQGMRWNDYAEIYTEPENEHLAALRAEIISKQIRRGGDWHQEDENGCPVFSDGTTALFSMRAWGDLLAAVWSEEDNADFHYMDFYMDDCTGKAGGATAPKVEQ